MELSIENGVAGALLIFVSGDGALERGPGLRERQRQREDSDERQPAIEPHMISLDLAQVDSNDE